ncbi:MAG: ATP-binding protein [Planctomycetota bacterium]|nr:ATP-binding protein [Planctomycetota bacterium]
MSVAVREQSTKPAKSAGEPAVAARMSIDDLRDLMHAFNQTTERLEATHTALRQEVARLKGELAEANDQLRRSRSLAALGEMAAGIAHEIRNPLGSIQLYVQMLGEDLAHDPDQSKLCEKIGRAVTGLDAIVGDVLLFARDMSVRCEEISAGELIDASLRSAEALLASAELEVRVEVPHNGSGTLHADRGLLTQALGNVIRNAVEAMAEAESPTPRLAITAGKKRVRCPDGRRGPRLVIAVEDSGPGIPEEVVQRMFNPFFTTRKTGTGLGLAIVHRIVDAHEGHITVSNVPSGGARVELCLPLRPDRAGRTRSEQEPPAVETVAGAGERIARPDAATGSPPTTEGAA